MIWGLKHYGLTAPPPSLVARPKKNKKNKVLWINCTNDRWDNKEVITAHYALIIKDDPLVSRGLQCVCVCVREWMMFVYEQYIWISTWPLNFSLCNGSTESEGHFVNVHRKILKVWITSSDCFISSSVYTQCARSSNSIRLWDCPINMHYTSFWWEFLYF